MATATPRAAGPFDHPGLLYHTADEYLEATTRFVRQAAGAGQPVLVAVPGPNLTRLRDALGDLGGAVTFADMTVAGRNPGRIIPGVLLAFAKKHARRRVAIIGEPIWPERTAVEYPACAAHEAMINAVFAGRDAAILCPYDADRLQGSRLHDAWRTHPTMITAGGRRASPWYQDPVATAADFNRPLPAVPAEAVRLPYAAPAALAEVRDFVAARATAAGLCGERVDDLVVAVNELAENTLRHTASGGTVSVWAEADYLVCQIDDRGRLTDPLAGRIPPPVDVAGGRGLVLANLLCDLLRIHTRPDGTTIRLHMTV
jgi:anti-sigma regulatory factor (Ser/Thr protein kinase)